MQQVVTLERRFIRRGEMYAVTGIRTRAWDDWARRGIGPTRIKAGRVVVYKLADVLTFLESGKQLRSPSGDHAAVESRTDRPEASRQVSPEIGPTRG